MRTRVAILALLLATAAEAQQRQPANVSTLPASSPQEFDLLDNTGRWVPFGTASGGTISLINALDPRSFGAKCDGVTDDSIALTAWAAAIKDGSAAHVVGKCVTRQPLTFPAVDHVVIAGDGIGASQLIYSGASTTVTPFNFGVAGTSCSIRQWTIADLSFESTTKMTAGYAVEISQLCIGFLHHIEMGSQFGGNINWWSGIHYNGGNTVKTYGLLSKGQDTGNAPGGVGVTVNGDTVNQFTDPDFLGVTLTGYKTAINIAGNSSFVMDYSDILQNDNQVRISQDVVAIGNNQIIFGSSTALDITYVGPEIDIVDPGGLQPWLILNGVWMSAGIGGGIIVESGTNWNVTVNGGRLLNMGKSGTPSDGLHNNSTTAKIQMNGVVIANNWGWGVNSTVTNPNIILTNIMPSNNALGNFSANVTPLTTAADNASFNVIANTVKAGTLTATAGNASVQWIPVGGTQPVDTKDWDIAENSTNGYLSFRALNDAYSSAATYMLVTRGATNTLTGAKISFFTPILASAYTIATLPTCNASLSGAIAYVSNGQASPPYLGAVSTTGAVVAPVFCNNTTWVYH